MFVCANWRAESPRAGLGYRRMSDGSVPLIRSDLLKAIHRSLLITCGVKRTRSFWQAHPLIHQGTVQGPVGIARHLADEANLSPLPWAFEVMNALEPFLLEDGIGIEAFVDSLLRYTNRASFVRSKTGLQWLRPLIGPLFRVVDPYRTVVRILVLALRQISQRGIIHEFPMRRGANGARQITLLTVYRELWDGALPAWDAPIFSAHIYRSSPPGIGLPPFDAVDTHADARRVEDIASGRSTEIRDGRFFIDGEAFGKVQRFSRFCREHGWHLPDYGQPDPDVVVIDRDWWCERRKRVVLRSDCAYGAPLCIFTFHWRLVRDRRQDFLKYIVEEAVSAEESEEENLARRLAEEFLAGHEAPVSCVYAANEDSIYVDGHRVCRGVPARILRDCITVYATTGRSHFTYREFKSDRSLISHPKNTGFEVRLRRLRAALDANPCGIRIESTGRGRFALRTRSRVTLVDSP